MDDRQTKRINEAARKFSEALMESYRATTGRTTSAQQLNAELTQSFFNAVIDNLRAQTGNNREMTQELVDQQRRQLEAAQTIAQESANAYMEFLDSLFFYRRSVEETHRDISAEPESNSENQIDNDLPLEDYDSLNVREVSDKLDELSVEEIRQLRSYEVRNKNRRTLMDRLNARIESDSS